MSTARCLFYLLIVSQLIEITPFSVSRYLFNYPRALDFSSLLTSVSSAIRDTPQNILDLASLHGLDGSRLQPPSGGGGGINNSGDFLGGNEGPEKRLLALPFILKNDTEHSEHSLIHLSAVDTKNYSSGKKAAERGVDNAIKRWWERNTAGSKGLLIYIFPAVCSQLAVLRTAVPFFLDRLSQYLQPIYIGLSFLLMQKKGASIIQATLWTSVLIGGYFMLSDTYNAGSSWVPLQAKNDSYAVITGATSGIGLELAKLLYRDGFSLILISKQGSSLEEIKAELLREQAGVDFSDIKQPEVEQGAATGSSVGSERNDFGAEDACEPTNNDATVTTSTESPTDFLSLNGRVSKSSSKRGTARCVASSTSYKSSAVSEYDGDYLFEDSSRDFSYDSNRKEEAEVSLANEKDTSKKIVTIACDLADPESAVYVMRELKKMAIDDKVDVLVNNAGSAVRGPLMLAGLDELSDTLDLNVKATVLLTRMLAPRIARRGTGGRILFVGSLSSVGPGPSVAVYAATKAFLQSFAVSLRRELMSEGVFVTLALPGAIRDPPFGARAGAEDALVFRGPGLSLSVEHTAHDIYKGLKQGRDVVVPGLVNKLYTYLFSQLLPSAAVGAITQAAWSPAPKWMPFLKPLASDLLLLEEQRRQKRTMREQQEADRAETMRMEKIRKREKKQIPFFHFNEKNKTDQPPRKEESTRSRDEGEDFSDMDEGSRHSYAAGDALLAKNSKKKNEIQKFGASIGENIQKKKNAVGQYFHNITERLHLPSKDEIMFDGFEAPVSRGPHYRRNRTDEGESQLERKLREAIEKEKKVAKREMEQDEQEEGAIGRFNFFKSAKSKFSNWALTFWYRPVIDYSAIREWAAKPFRPKGQDIVLDEESEQLGDRNAPEVRKGEVCKFGMPSHSLSLFGVDDYQVGISHELGGRYDTVLPTSTFEEESVTAVTDDHCDSPAAKDSEDIEVGEGSVGVRIPPVIVSSEGSGLETLAALFKPEEDDTIRMTPRVRELKGDLAFKSSVSPIHTVTSTALLSREDSDVIMQRHQVLISSGRLSPLGSTLGSFQGVYTQPLDIDPLSSSVLGYLSGGGRSIGDLAGDTAENKSDFETEGESDGERVMSGCEERKCGVPFLLQSVEDVGALEPVLDGVIPPLYSENEQDNQINIIGSPRYEYPTVPCLDARLEVTNLNISRIIEGPTMDVLTPLIRLKREKGTDGQTTTS